MIGPAPKKATLAEQVARANQGLPDGLEIRAIRGRYGHRIFAIREHGVQVAEASNLTGAIFLAMRRAPTLTPPSEIPPHG